VGRLFCLFVCYRVQESRDAMDGGGGSCIEDDLAKGMAKASIRGSMRKKKGADRCLGWWLLFFDNLASC
jgi:hypothetical protein